VFFCNSGAEANEAGFKLARRHGAARGATTVVATTGSFHGRTMGALSLTGQPAKREPFEPLVPDVRFVPYGDAAALDAALDASVAAVLIEPIQGEGGVVPAPPGYLAAARAACDRVGALLMVDEVQTGFGRTGSWFAFQADGIEPDVVLLAKALGNGMPIGACWARGAAATALVPGDHGTTFGGQPLAARTALTVLDVMAREDVLGRARDRGAHLEGGLLALDGVTAVRGRGLLLAAELASGIDAKDVATRALAHGLIVNAVTPTALRFAPPLLVTETEVDEAAAILAAVLSEVQ
jgi:acetylornithine/succinyldiaminopimelate/putrescine aminotransferase